LFWRFVVALNTIYLVAGLISPGLPLSRKAVIQVSQSKIQPSGVRMIQVNRTIVYDAV